MPITHPPREVQSGRFERFLQRILNLKGAGRLRSVLPDLRSTINLTGPVLFEERLYKGWLSYSCFVSSAAPGAGNVNVYRLNNPAGSGVLVSVDSYAFNPAAATECRIGLVTPFLALPQTVGPLDTRIGVDSMRSAAIFNVEVAIGVPPINQLLFGHRSVTLSAFPPSQSLAIILTPGRALMIVQTTLNAADSLHISWSERGVDPGELAPS